MPYLHSTTLPPALTTSCGTAPCCGSRPCPASSPPPFPPLSPLLAALPRVAAPGHALPPLHHHPPPSHHFLRHCPALWLPTTPYLHSTTLPPILTTSCGTALRCDYRPSPTPCPNQCCPTEPGARGGAAARRYWQRLCGPLGGGTAGVRGAVPSACGGQEDTHERETVMRVLPL